MRLREFNLNIFLGMLDALHTKVEIVRIEAKEWKTNKGYTDGWSRWQTGTHRSKLEEALEELRFELATIYDFMHERGLVEHEWAVGAKDKLKGVLDGIRQEASRLERDHSDNGTHGSKGFLAVPNRLHGIEEGSEGESRYGYPI